MQTVNIVLLISITSHIKHGQRLKAQHTSQPPFFHQMHQVFSCEHTYFNIDFIRAIEFNFKPSNLNTTFTAKPNPCRNLMY